MLRDYGNEMSAAGGDAVTVTAFTPPGKAQGVMADGGLATPVARDWGIGEVTKFFGYVTQAFNNLTSLDIELGGADDTAGTNFVSYVKVNFLLAALPSASTCRSRASFPG